MKLYVTLCVYILFCESFVHLCRSLPPLKLRKFHRYVEIDNGIIKLTLTNPTGHIAGVAYKGIKNVVEYRSKESQRGYWDIMWSTPGKGRSFLDKLEGNKLRVIADTGDKIEVSFTRIWNFSVGKNVVPLNIDKRYIVLRGVSGFYSYAIFQHLKGWPDLNMDEARIVLKLRQNMFHYMAISDNMQKIMPTEQDRERGRFLDYKEAVHLTNPYNPTLKGQVDDKYQYSLDNKDAHVHGWISIRPRVGVWVITPRDEFRSGGPLKQELTSHTSATSLAIFFSSHYAGPTFGVRLRGGERWQKVFGPVFVYLNSDAGNRPSALWKDAKRQMSIEKMKWPYNFIESEDFPRANRRGNVRGRLLVHDRYIRTDPIPARSAYIGLAPPGIEGSWQDDAKGYQFWTRTDENGYFVISNVRPDTYDLYAWVPGFIGDFKHQHRLVIQPGSEIRTGDLVYHPPRKGPTLWEIGIPDRTAAEFYIPDPVPEFMTKLFIRQTEKYRQYGLWDRYTDLYPTEDLVYTVGSSNYTKDWFFAHVNRKTGKNYVPTTWTINFAVKNVVRRGDYTLWIALASANMAEIQVRINEPNTSRPHFTTRQIGRDNAIARHGIHGRYWLYSVNIPGVELVNNARNTIYLKQARGSYPFIGVMYDYLRLEATPQG